MGPTCRLPRVIFSDRGTGMYAPSGQVVAAYECAVRECNFRLFWGPGAKKQSPDMPDLLLHETALAPGRAEAHEAGSRTLEGNTGAVVQAGHEGARRGKPELGR